MTTSINDASRPKRCPPNTTSGKVLTRRVTSHDRTTLVLTYTTSDAQQLRRMVQDIRLKDGRKPSMSLIARRALEVYVDRLPANLDEELSAMNRMTTPAANPAGRHRA